MIPKKIHYCWFGRNPKPALAEKCIASWKKYCPDYEIIEWNEDNFDLDCNGYTRYCYDNKKWAFLSDFVRIEIIAQQGGLYFDTDVELLRSPDEFLQYGAFYGFENDAHVNTGEGFGSEAGHPSILAMKKQYTDLKPNEDGSYPIIGCPVLNTQALVHLGLKLDGSRQNIAGAEILPADYMNPYDDPTGLLNKTKNTVSIHWYSKSWLSKGIILRSKIMKPLHRIFGVDAFKRFRK